MHVCVYVPAGSEEGGARAREPFELGPFDAGGRNGLSRPNT